MSGWPGCNGLHERNNSEGHEAGDRMLKAVAEQFGRGSASATATGLAGTNLLSFTLGMPEEMVKQLAEELKKALEKDGIYVSVGPVLERKVSIIDLSPVGGKQMYAAKKNSMNRRLMTGDVFGNDISEGKEEQKMDERAMNCLTYGLFVLTARRGEKDNGCIVNTVQQVTAQPNRIGVAVNKLNFTHDMIMDTGVFNVSII